MILPGLRFTVLGVAAPQGSKRHVGRGRLVEASKRVKPWRELIVQTVREALPESHTPIEGPVLLRVLFYLPRPAAAKNRLYPHKGGPGDLDKLVRAVGDALTSSGVWKDDAQVVQLIAEKRYTGPTSTVGPFTQITVTELTE